MISDDEIVERLVYALVNEGARILEEGIASKASDIDVVYLTGYGFPIFRGGPMFHADTVGLTTWRKRRAATARGIAAKRGKRPRRSSGWPKWAKVSTIDVEHEYD